MRIGGPAACKARKARRLEPLWKVQEGQPVRWGIAASSLLHDIWACRKRITVHVKWRELFNVQLGSGYLNT